MKALFLNSKMVFLTLFMSMVIVAALLSSFDAKAVNCNLFCKRCGSGEINHFHDSKTGVIYVFCRDCEAYYEINP